MDIIYRFDPHSPLTRPAYSNPVTALQALHDGNERFATMVGQVQAEMLGGPAPRPIVIPSDPLSLAFPIWGGEAPVQSPFALVLGCSDARAPVEVIFDQGCNALFVIRIAGNVLGIECLGSIDYALRHMGKSISLMVVLGHTACGAVTGAVDTYLKPDDYADVAFTYALRSLVDSIQLAVRGAAKALERVSGSMSTHGPGFRSALLETSVYMNAAVTAFDVRRELAKMKLTSVKVVYGVYDLVTQRVRGLPASRPEDVLLDSGFGEAPQTAEELTELGTQVARRIVHRSGF